MPCFVKGGIAFVGLVDQVGDLLRHAGGVEFESEFLKWHGVWWSLRGSFRDAERNSMGIVASRGGRGMLLLVGLAPKGWACLRGGRDE